MHKKLLQKNGKVTTKSQIPKAASNASPREGTFSRKHVEIYARWQKLFQKALRPAMEVQGYLALCSSISNPEIRMVAILSFQYKKI